MSTATRIPLEELEEVPSPYPEPQLGFLVYEPRKVNNLTLIDGKTFLSTTVSGDITPPGAPDVGFFHDDTRFLSRLELRVGGQRTVVLSSSTENTFASKIELTTSTLAQINSFDLPENTIHIRRQQLLASDVLYDSITVSNFNQSEAELLIEIAVEADFVDVFQVRGCARHKSGHYYRPIARGDSLIFSYLGLDNVSRETILCFQTTPDEIDNNVLRWKLKVPATGFRELLNTVTCHVAGRTPRSKGKSVVLGFRERRDAYRRWEQESTSFKSSNDIFDEALRTCTADFHALQIPDGDQHVVAAGVPWFATMFGRDSLIAAYQSLLLNPRLACETLRVLARYQGKRSDDWLDEEPGKIPHEYRSGEMTRAGEMPFGPYYGSVDATPLFLMLLSETFNWTGDADLVEELLPAAHAALEWIENYGDLDGDGFIEYKRRSPKGLTNQGWKDSWDANMHRDGSVANPPIALVEVQGYCHEAQYRMAQLLRLFGDTSRADKLRKSSAELAKRIEKSFWLPNEGFYAMGLDSAKRPLEVISSNPGHLLFTRSIAKDRARLVVQRFMHDDMQSGWGWRTLARSERVFNPLSYHRGSVWPHDNSLVAHGMALYGFRDEVKEIFTSLYQASLNFRDYRLPELFCGVQRHENDEPVHYPVSCSPQAWASGAFFLLLTSLLGIRPSAPRKELNIVNPMLPDWLDYLRIRNLSIGKSRVSLDFSRSGERTFCNVVDVSGEKLLINVAFRK
ncbi:MAG TPA: glycogen debranching N-terminal domain-containing protein [Terriglobales bacterium]|jgi:glycogen debranching enzyme|nr:glycogen debranching N-terminal domain-containing protein [Terriglobales bacterium]